VTSVAWGGDLGLISILRVPLETLLGDVSGGCTFVGELLAGERVFRRFRSRSLSELTKSLVLAVAFAAFILAAYLQEGGSWRGPHNLRKSLPAKGAAIGMQQDRYGWGGCYVSVRS
jgi:hypothetical protein